MSQIPFTTEERRYILDRYYQVLHNLTAPNNKQFTMPQRQAMAKERDALMQEYAERIPFVPLSACPFCADIVEYPIDTVGFDGPWWFKDELAKYPRPAGCPHFRVLLGAMDFKQTRNLEGRFVGDIIPGPGVPFVVPRLLTAIPEMKVVISSFKMPQGCVCYPAAYFSAELVDAAMLHQPWARQAYDVLDEDGKFQGWKSVDDKWDFELQPWIDNGKLLWINPGDTSMTLQNRPPCPYVNLPGTRAPQRIVAGRIETRSLPGGKELQPFE